MSLPFSDLSARLYQAYSAHDLPTARALLAPLPVAARNALRPWDDVLFLAMLASDPERNAALVRLAALLLELEVDPSEPDEFGVDAFTRIHRLAVHRPALAQDLFGVTLAKGGGSPPMSFIRRSNAARIRYMSPEGIDSLLTSDPEARRVFLGALLAPDHYWFTPPSQLHLLRVVLRHCEGTDVVAEPLCCATGNTAMHLAVLLALGPWRRTAARYRTLQRMTHMQERTRVEPDENTLVPVVSLLLDHGADPARPNREGESAMQLYARCATPGPLEQVFARATHAHGRMALTVVLAIVKGDRGSLLSTLDLNVFRDYIMPHMAWTVSAGESYGARLTRRLETWDGVVVERPAYFLRHLRRSTALDSDSDTDDDGFAYPEDPTGLVDLYLECQRKRPRLTPALRAEFRFRRRLVDGGRRVLVELLRARRQILRLRRVDPARCRGGLNGAARMCVRQRLSLLAAAGH